MPLARAWPDAVSRDALAEEAFGARRINASQRARLRAEMGRLRKMMEDLGAEPTAKGDGYALTRDDELIAFDPDLRASKVVARGSFGAEGKRQIAIGAAQGRFVNDGS